MGDRDETSQWLPRLQHTPAQICVEKPVLRCPGKPQRAFQEEAGRRFGGCPTLCAGMGAELRLPLLTIAHPSNAATTLQVPVPGHVPHWPDQSDLTGWPLYSGWPSYCPWACFEQESLMCVLGFTSVLPHHQELVWPLHWTWSELHSSLNLVSVSRPTLLASWRVEPWLLNPPGCQAC